MKEVNQKLQEYITTSKERIRKDAQKFELLLSYLENYDLYHDDPEIQAKIWNHIKMEIPQCYSAIEDLKTVI